MATTHAHPESEHRDEESPPFIKWVPLVVPLFAVLLATLVYLIGAEVL